MADATELARRATERLRLPPHSVEAEQSMLGGLMLDQRAWDQIADVVSAEDLYRADHRLIFGAIAALVERNQPPDAVTVSEHLQRLGQLEAAGGLPYLARLVEDTPSAANIRAYARIVRDHAMLRQLIEIGGDIAASAHATQGLTASEIVDRAEARVFEIAEHGQRRGSGFVALKQILPKTIDRLDFLSHSTSEITGVSTGFVEMDKMTAGLQRGELIIIAGRPSMGKCVVSGSRILNPETGALETIDDCVRNRRGNVVSLDARGRLQPAQASDFVDDGVKPVFELKTALGRRVLVTAPHPFLTPSGWQPLASLRPGGCVAVPRALPFFGTRSLADSLVKLAAYFIADGGLTQSVPMFTNANTRVLRDFSEAVAHFPGMRCRIESRAGTRAQTIRVVRSFEAIRRARHAFAEHLRSFLSERGLTLTAFASSVGVTTSAVHHWTTGAVAPGAGLLPRLRSVGFDAPAEPESAAIHKNGDNPVKQWLAEIGLWGRSAHTKHVPAQIFELPREKIALFLNRAFTCDGSIYVQNEDQVGISYSTVSERLARDMQHLLLRFGIVAKLRYRSVPYCGTRRTAYELRIVRQEDIARFVREIGIFGKERAAAKALRISLRKRPNADEELANLATSDIYWDRIESIEHVGERQVYDLTVPEHHNFVAEDIVVHNTTLAINIAENAALGQKIPAAIFSMEMSAEQLSFRMLSSIGRIGQQRLRTGKLHDEDWPRVDSAVSMMSDAPIYVDDSGALTPTEVRARARRLKREHGLGLIVVDYLQLMQVSGTVENRATEISEISRSLKALAKELDVPVIALSQLNRSVEQRQDKRPVMSDLRECVTGDTLVCLTDGRRLPIRDLVDTEPEVWAVDDSQRLVASRADKVWKVGSRTVFRVELASGRSIRATRDHRLLAGRGWVTLGELAVGDRLALGRRIPEPAAPEHWPDHALILLGHLVGDGSYLSHQPLRYTTSSEANSSAVREAAEAFGSKVTRYAGRGAWHQLVISGNGNRWIAAGVGRWLKDLGIFNQRSHEKRLPEAVFTLARDRIALLLRHLWATDGSITLRRSGRGAPRVYFATCSEGLARDVAALLLRLEIVARIRVVQPASGRPMYSVDVSGASAQRRFLETVGGYGPRAGGAASLAGYLANVESNTNVDTLPVEVFTAVRARMRASGVTTRRMAVLRGTAYGGASHFQFAPSRDLTADYARLLDAPEIARWAESDVFWDRVVAVTEDGEEDVYDLTVPGPSCWLADGIVSHNSGAIEQDADLIMFIYREEVYERDTPRKGIADIIVAKQRNGPVGDFRLTFLGEYTKFENLVAEAYGEGVF
jgi:replicative DNA helicase